MIELLIVVAIIAILAAIAVPNFLEAQTRSKASRARADMRSIASAIESYHVDYNHYPPGYGTAERYGLDALTTPIAFLTSGAIFDPFTSPGTPPWKRYLTYELVNSSGLLIEAGGAAYTIDPASPGGEDATGVAWWVASRGPDKSFGFKSVNPEFNIRQRFFESNNNPGLFVDIVYDPTNGTNSLGNLYRSGGAPVRKALQIMNAK